MSTPQRLPIVSSDDGTWGDILRQYLKKEHYDDGNPAGNAANGGHQTITIRAGTTAAGTAPIKLTSGSLMTAAEAGAVEFLTDTLYFTQTTGTTRKTVAIYDDTSGATGDIHYRDSGGALIRLGVGGSNNLLTVSGGVPSWTAAPTLGNTSTVTLKDTLFTLQDDGDTTKQAQFQLSGITTGTTRTLTIPDSNTTIAGTDAVQMLTNKTIDGASNTLTNLPMTSLTPTSMLASYNPSFAINLSNWTISAGSWVYDGTTGHSANGSAKIVADGNVKDLNATKISVTPGTTYTFGAWVSGSSLTDPSGTGAIYISVDTYNGASYVATPPLAGYKEYWNAIYGNTGTLGWTYLAGQYTIPSSGVDGVILTLAVEAAVTGGSIWFDDAVMFAPNIDQSWIKGLGASLDSIWSNWGALSSKTLDNSNIVTLKDVNFTLQDDGDTTKQAKFQLSGLTASTTRTYTLPDASGTVPLKYTILIGDGASTSIAVTHNLGTKNCTYSVRDASTDAIVDCDVVMTSTTQTTFTFQTAPASNAYQVVIIG